MQIDGSVFDLLANVRKKADGAFVYSIQLNQNKKIKASPPLGSLLRASSGVPNASGDRVPHSDPEVKLSERETESLSNRSLLANAFEGLAQNDVEKAKMAEYKANIAAINEQERILHETNASDFGYILV